LPSDLLTHAGIPPSCTHEFVRRAPATSGATGDDEQAIGTAPEPTDPGLNLGNSEKPELPIDSQPA